MSHLIENLKYVKNKQLKEIILQTKKREFVEIIPNGEEMLRGIRSPLSTWFFSFGINDACLKIELSSKQFVIIYENAVNLASLFEKYDLSKILKNPNFLIFTSMVDMENWFMDHLFVKEDIDFFVSPEYGKKYIVEFRQFIEIVKNVKSMKLSHIETLIQFSHKFADSNLQNLTNISKYCGILYLKDVFKNKPAIIVSPGPSLSKNIHYLQSLYDKAIIIATNPSTSILRKWNIRPNFICNVEAQNYSYHLSENEDFLDKTFLSLLSQSHPDYFNINCAGKFVYFNSSEISGMYLQNKNPELFEKGRGASGGSVSTDATFLAYFMGCNPIIFVGQDLSFAKNGQNYSAFSVESDGKMIKAKDNTISFISETRKEKTQDKDVFVTNQNTTKIIKCKGLFHKEVETKSDYFAYKAWFENFRKNISPDIQLINCTEGGVIIDGFDIAPLSVICKAYQDKPQLKIFEFINHLYNRYNRDNSVKVKKFIDNEIVLCQKFLINLNSILNDCQNLLNDLNNTKLREKINRDSKNVIFQKSNLKIIESFVQKEIIEYEVELRKNENNDIKTNLLHNIKMYHFLIKGTSKYLENLQKR